MTDGQSFGQSNVGKVNRLATMNTIIDALACKFLDFRKSLEATGVCRLSQEGRTMNNHRCMVSNIPARIIFSC